MTKNPRTGKLVFIDRFEQLQSLLLDMTGNHRFSEGAP
jgi:hypothetical protein